MARKDTLGKLKMPGKPMAESEAEMDLGLEELGTEELSDEEGMMSEEEGGLGSPLDEFSDDDIIAEMQLRGLSLDEMEDELEDLDEDEEDFSEPEMITGDI